MGLECNSWIADLIICHLLHDLMSDMLRLHGYVSKCPLLQWMYQEFEEKKKMCIALGKTNKV